MVFLLERNFEMKNFVKSVAHAFGTAVAGSTSALSGAAFVIIGTTHIEPAKDILSAFLFTASTTISATLSILTAAFALSQFARCYQAVRAFEQDIATPVDTRKNTEATTFHAPGFDL